MKRWNPPPSGDLRGASGGHARRELVPDSAADGAPVSDAETLQNAHVVSWRSHVADQWCRRAVRSCDQYVLLEEAAHPLPSSRACAISPLSAGQALSTPHAQGCRGDVLALVDPHPRGLDQRVERLLAQASRIRARYAAQMKSADRAATAARLESDRGESAQ